MSAILNITLLDSQGHSITQLDSPLIICFPLPDNAQIDPWRVCLSYYNEPKDKWICEDKCLTTAASNASKSGPKGGNLLCGQTDHLTNFALLLIGPEEEDPCQSGKDNTLTWISVGFAGGAILAVAFSVFLLEIYFRWKVYDMEKQLEKVCTLIPNV